MFYELLMLFVATVTVTESDNWKKLLKYNNPTQIILQKSHSPQKLQETTTGLQLPKNLW
jgi:hypothetical protein